MRSTICHKFGLYFWKEQSALLAKEQVKKVNIKMKSKDDIIRFTEDMFEKKFEDNDF